MSTTNTNNVSSTGSTQAPVSPASEQRNPVIRVGLRVSLCPRCDTPMRAHPHGGGEYFFDCHTCNSVRDPFEDDEIDLAQTAREKPFLDRLFTHAS